MKRSAPTTDDDDSNPFFQPFMDFYTNTQLSDPDTLSTYDVVQLIDQDAEKENRHPNVTTNHRKKPRLFEKHLPPETATAPQPARNPLTSR